MKYHNRPGAKYIGVYAHGPGKWRGIVTLNQIKHSAGTYTSMESAARARDMLAYFLHGKYAVFNFPDEVPCYER